MKLRERLGWILVAILILGAPIWVNLMLTFSINGCH